MAVDLNVSLSQQGTAAALADLDQIIQRLEKIQSLGMGRQQMALLGVGAGAPGVAPGVSGLRARGAQAAAEINAGAVGPAAQLLQEVHNDVLGRVKQRAYPTSPKAAARQVLRDLGDPDALRAEQEEDDRKADEAHRRKIDADARIVARQVAAKRKASVRQAARQVDYQQQQEVQLAAEPYQERAREAAAGQQEQHLVSQIARFMGRGVDPFKVASIRVRAAALAGTDDPGTVDAQIEAMRAQAIQQRQAPGAAALGGPLGSFLRKIQIAGGLAAAGSYFGQAQYAAGAGEPFRPEEHMGEFLGVGAGFAAAIPGIGIPVSAALGIAALVAHLGDQFNRGRRELNQASMGAAVELGLTPGAATGMALDLGDVRDPATGAPVGAAGALRGMAATRALGMAGATNAQREAQAKYLLRTFGPQFVESGTAAQAPFLNDPWLANQAKLAQQFNAEALGRRETGTGGYRDNPFVNTGTVLGGYAQFGYQGTYDYLTSALPAPSQYGQRRDLQGGLRAFHFEATRREMDTSIAGYGAQSGAALFETGLAQGQDVDSQVMRSLNLQRSSLLQGQADALRKQLAQWEAVDRGIGPIHEKVVQYGALLDQVNQTIQQNLQGYRVQQYAIAGARATVGLAEAGAAMAAGQYSRPAGTVNAGMGETRTAVGEALRIAVAQSKDDTIPWQMREAAKAAIPGLQTQLNIDLRRQAFEEAYAEPAEKAANVLGRERSALGLYTGLGAEPGVVERSFQRTRGQTAEAIQTQQTLVDQLKQAYETKKDPVTWRELDAAQTQLLNLQIGQRQTDIAALSYRPDFRRARAGEAAGVAGGEAGLLSSLGLGSAGAIAAAQFRYGFRMNERDTVREQISAQLEAGRPDDAKTRSLLMEYQAIQVNAAAEMLGPMTTYQPTAKQTLALGQTQLAEQLAAGDIATGGFVPIGLRQERMKLLASQLGQLDSFVASRPEGPLRDLAAANAQGQRASLLVSMQEERNAMQFGEIGHLINIGVGLGSNFNLRSGATVANFQRFNPGGTRALGGSGEGVALSPFAALAMQGMIPGMNVAQAMGGTGSIAASGLVSMGPFGGGGGPVSAGGDNASAILSVLQQILGAIVGGGTSPAGGSVELWGTRGGDRDPLAQAQGSVFSGRK